MSNAWPQGLTGPVPQEYQQLPAGVPGGPSEPTADLFHLTGSWLGPVSGGVPQKQSLRQRFL